MPPITIPLLDNIVRPGETVLDVGCGGTPYHRATALVDFTLDGDAAREFAATAYREELPGVPFHLACAEDLPFPDGAFDWCVCRFALTLMEDPVKACDEMSRVARKHYIEFPSATRELLANTPGAKWLGKRDGDALVFLRKTEQPFWTAPWEFCGIRFHSDAAGMERSVREALALLEWAGDARVVLIGEGRIEARVG